MERQMSFLNRIEIIVGHGELALYKKILYFLHYFQKSSVTKVLKWASVEANMLNCCFKQYVMSSFSAVISVTRVPKPILNLCFNVIIRKCWFSCSSVPGLVDSFCNKYKQANNRRARPRPLWPYISRQSTIAINGNHIFSVLAVNKHGKSAHPLSNNSFWEGSLSFNIFYMNVLIINHKFTY